MSSTFLFRFNYLLWIEDLLQANAGHFDDKESVLGLDIGVGSSCIYPLLAAAHLGWNMIGTELDADNLKNAQENVGRNRLESKIQLFGGSSSPGEEGHHRFLFPVQEEGKFLFSMCNPPFYEADEKDAREGKEDDELGIPGKKNRIPSFFCEI